jgi:single-stranded-DNA-specific exonuclease
MLVSKMIVRRQPTTTCHFSESTPAILQRIYLNREISDETHVKTDLSALIPFQQLLHIEKAADLLAQMVQQQKHILIIGDYDADGATSTALAVSALKKMGVSHVNYLIPNRFEFGYGLTPEIVEVAAQRNPDLLITVDNGISSHAGVARAKSLGMKVLVTDHHLAADTLPIADVIVNPNQVGDVFPSKALAGVGVIFYVMLALRSRLRELQWFQQQGLAEPNMTQFLDLVALGTVADVVPLDQNNRILVHQGLKRIRAGLARHGIQALLQASQRPSLNIVATDLGFTVAPRLNAAGRLDDMSLGVECLLAESWVDALRMAYQLDVLNRERREIETGMLTQAEKLLATITFQSVPHAICLYEPEWHQGVIGILAGRIKDRYHRPTIVFAKANENELKGSARSISSIHLRDTLALIDMQNPRLIEKFGGHAMAAGLTLKTENFVSFTQIFHETVSQQLTPEKLQNILHSDGELCLDEFTTYTASIIRNCGPWGQGFPEPLFDGSFQIIEQRLINDKHLKLLLKPSHADISLEAIAFNRQGLLEKKQIQMAYRLDIDEFKGNKKLQLIVEYIA